MSNNHKLLFARLRLTSRRGIAALFAGAVSFSLMAGFGLGVYVLPIIIETPAPSAADMEQYSRRARYVASFAQDQPGNDWLHWTKGQISISPSHVVFDGEIAPGPDYRLYLTPTFPADEEQFLTQQAQSVVLGRVSNFSQFILAVPEGVDLSRYTSAVIWCETFEEFIGAAKYR